MAKEIKKRRTKSLSPVENRVEPAGKRVTKKGTQSNPNRARTIEPIEDKPSPIIVPILMFGCFAIGVLIIMASYLFNAHLPSAIQGVHAVLIGLGFICLGFIASTRYR